MAEPGDVLEAYPQPESPVVNNESLVEAQSALEQLDDAAREVVELHLHASLTFQEIAAVVENSEQIEISPLKVSTTTIDGRQPILGIDLDVGKPIISTRKLETSIRVTDGGETSGIVLPGPPGRHAILFLSVRRLAKEEQQTITNPVVEPNSSAAPSPKPNP